MRSKYVLQNDKKSHVDYIVFIFFVRTEKWCKSIWANYQCTGAQDLQRTGQSTWKQFLEPGAWFLEKTLFCACFLYLG